MPKPVTRPLQPVPRYTLTRREAAASLGISLNHFERRVQPELKVVASGQLILIPVTELERWVQRHARYMVETPVERARGSPLQATLILRLATTPGRYGIRPWASALVSGVDVMLGPAPGADALVEHVWREVGSGWPDDRAGLGIDGNLAEAAR